MCIRDSSDTVGFGNSVNAAVLEVVSIIDKVPETVVSNIPLPCVPIKSLLSDGRSTKALTKAKPI